VKFKVRRAIWSILRWFLFAIDAETAHRVTLSGIHLGLKLSLWFKPLRLRPLAWISGVEPVSCRKAEPVTVFGRAFLSPVGLAAGFDKDAEIIGALPDLGFGFAEIGTVTPRPQPGNERPRLFRDYASQSVFNRMGFNGLGAAIVSERLEKARPHLPPGFRVGVNIGKNKETPLEDAHHDYRAAATPFRGLADYVVINVSSPNTPGLRTLQALEPLRPIVHAVAEVLAGWPDSPALLLKLAPELSAQALGELIPALEGWGIEGWVLTNTLAGVRATKNAGDLPGGISGEPLVSASRESLKRVRALSNRPIISVGGILTVQEAKLRLLHGANLVQLYSGWIFAGPSFPAEVAHGLRVS